MLLLLEWLMHLEMHLEIREHHHQARLAASYATGITAAVQLSKREEDFPSCKPLLLKGGRPMGRVVVRGQIPKTISHFRCHLGSLVQCDGFYSLKAGRAGAHHRATSTTKEDQLVAAEETTAAVADHRSEDQLVAAGETTVGAGGHRVVRAAAAATTMAPPQTLEPITEETTSLILYHRIRT